MKHYYLFIVGGVMSGVGKGAATASVGKVLQEKGYKVTAMKIDPYINVDAGTMNPLEHGEVFVTHDGDETDQDIGNYERFLEINISKINYMTTGRVYQSVINRERNLEYHGKTVQVVPDVPNEVIDRIEKAASAAKADFTLIEIGGTVGEYENILFLEAARLLRMKYPDQVRNILVSYMPVPGNIGEMKTKPTQQAVRLMMGAGLYPDFVIARSITMIDEPRRKKLAMFSNVREDAVIGSPDVKSIYEIPLIFETQHFGEKILKSLFLSPRPRRKIVEWKKLIHTMENSTKEVKIGIVGKYFSTGDFLLSDVYLSVIEAVKHACWSHRVKPQFVWLNSELFEKEISSIAQLNELDGVVIPGGFGSRGIEGKIRVIQYCREKKIPYFGLCYGMQCAVIEFARNVLGFAKANTTEIDPSTKHPVIHLMADQQKNILDQKMGGTLRLGTFTCNLQKDSLAREAYKSSVVYERHRHRYEFNNDYRDILEKAGLVYSGINPERNLVEIIELKDHPFFVGVQFHPEFVSKPRFAHPLFKKFIERCL